MKLGMIARRDARSGAGSAISPPPAAAKGCLKGALVGGVAGHYAGHHAILGAIGGCIVGRHLANQQEKEKAARPLRGRRRLSRPLPRPTATNCARLLVSGLIVERALGFRVERPAGSGRSVEPVDHPEP